MTTSNKTKGYVPTTALAKEVTCDDVLLHITLIDGRLLAVPLAWFPILHAATPVQRQAVEIGMGGRSLHWEAIDEDILVANLLAGADSHAS